MEFKLKTYHRNTPDEEFIEDVSVVAKKLRKNKVTKAEYEEYGRFHPTTLCNRFGDWGTVLLKAGLKKEGSGFHISDEDLFLNIQEMWIRLGRQPKYKEVQKPFSKFSTKPYENRFGSWLNALEKFVEYINSGDNEENFSSVEPEYYENSKKNHRRRTSRNISDRLRFSILLRDGFTCQSCGASPLKQRDVELHVDHVIPWSKGGETEKSNLETKCSKCNLGKGNFFAK